MQTNTPWKFHNGLTLHRQGRLAEAEDAYEDVLRSDPRHFDALQLLGALLAQTGRPERAVELISRAIELNSGMASTFSNRAMALCGLDRFEEALADCDRAIGMVPDYLEAWSNRGNALLGLGRLEEAVACYDKALAINPDFPLALNSRGFARHRLNQFEEALTDYDRALALNPDFPEAHNNRGLALQQLQRRDAAVAAFDQALVLRPDYVEAISNRAGVLSELGRLDEALAGSSRVLALRPNADLFKNHGNIQIEARRLDEALSSFSQALALAPGHLPAVFNTSLVQLLRGDFACGLANYEARASYSDLPQFRPRPEPRWTGMEDVRGKTVFVYWEQGLGDTLQFCRYLTLLEDLGAKVVFSLQNRLRRLVTTLSPTIELIDETATPAQFDFHIPLMSLPHAFRTELSAIPAEVPYLSAEPDRIARWREKIGAHGFRIGVAWQGGGVGWGWRRSIPASCFEPLSRISSVRLISLQNDVRGGNAIETLGEDFDAGPDAFIDSAAVMESLDLIITCDTSILHLAGAMRRPVWGVLRFASEWRWLLDRDDSPWYPTARLFRQQAPDDWAGVFREIESSLTQAVKPGDG